MAKYGMTVCQPRPRKSVAAREHGKVEEGEMHTTVAGMEQQTNKNMRAALAAGTAMKI
jgi:hypothetical protein